MAHLNKRLSGARAALAKGEVDQVRDLVAALQAELGRSDLSPAQRAKFERKLAALAAADRARRGPRGAARTLRRPGDPDAQGRQGPQEPRRPHVPGH